MILNTLTAAFFAFAPTTNAADVADFAPATIQASVQDPTPPQAKKFETAFSRESTPENEQWFSELIALNPNCTVVIVGHGIAVSQEGGLTLPRTPRPGNVNLTDPV
ncbi:MAG: hypothetical protein AB8H80_17605 [Planctomycetota bacterium]